MPAIPLGLSAYRRADMPPVTLKNMVYERTPANLEDQVALMPRPRLVGEYAAGNGPIRGVFRKGGAILDRLLALSGDKLFGNYIVHSLSSRFAFLSAFLI